jgi:acetylornithine deacetylase/succinyl-diaminopimelate desuccinylase-like protein
VEAVIEQLKSLQDTHLEWTRTLCRFPSISTLSEHQGDVRAAAEWLRDLCQQIKLENVSLVETPGHPAILADLIVDPAAPTYLVYGHYDVQPTGDLSLWDADPFEPVIKDEWLICRGSADDKGQVLLYLRALDAWLKAGQKPPVNIKLLIEGEEEIGSPNLAGLIEQHKERLVCDHILVSDTGMYADGWPTITYGTRGLLYKEIVLTSLKHDLHSGSFGGTVPNPAHELSEIITSLHDEAGWVTIPGFYANVAEVPAEEREALGSLPFERDDYLSDTGATELVGESGYTTNERRWIRPTLDVNGITSGFQGEGANTIIPARASAKLSMRLVPNQDAERLSRLFDQAIRERCPAGIKLEIIDHGNADPYVAPLDSKPMQAAKIALQAAFDQEPAFIREGGSLPILPMFRRLLGADTLMLGFASPTCNAHGPNEKLRLPDADSGAEGDSAVAKGFRG